MKRIENKDTNLDYHTTPSSKGLNMEYGVLTQWKREVTTKVLFVPPPECERLVT